MFRNINAVIIIFMKLPRVTLTAVNLEDDDGSVDEGRQGIECDGGGQVMRSQRADGIGFLRSDLHHGCSSKITIFVLQLKKEDVHNEAVLNVHKRSW